MRPLTMMSTFFISLNFFQILEHLQKVFDEQVEDRGLKKPRYPPGLVATKLVLVRRRQVSVAPVGQRD